MPRNTLTISSVVALLGLVGTAQAATTPQNNRSDVRDTIRDTEVDINLTGAIEAAEDKTDSTAISATVRMLTPAELRRFSTDQADGNQPEESAKRTAKREAREGWKNELFAVVTCMMDDGRVRDVFVRLSNGTTVGTGSSTFGRSDSGDRTSDSRPDSNIRIGDNNSVTDAFERIRLYSGVDLMNAAVTNFRGVALGDLDDLAIDPTTGRLVYGVLLRGGLLGIGQSLYAIPSDELAVFRDGTIHIDLNDSDFDDSKGFNPGKWPMRADAQWDTNWVSETKNMPAAEFIVRGSDLIGMNVTDRNSETVGEVENVFIDALNGKAVYLVVSTDRGLMPVPFKAISMASPDDDITISKSSDELRSIETMDSTDDVNWNNAGWNRRVHEAFGQKPDWMKK